MIAIFDVTDLYTKAYTNASPDECFIAVPKEMRAEHKSNLFSC